MSAERVLLQEGKSHPYFPLTLSLPHYRPSALATPQVLTILAGLAAAIIIAALVISRGRDRTFGDRTAVTWFLLCFFIHLGLEGYFVWNNRTLAGMQSLFADLWREYSLSDSRYLSSDPFTVSMEAITAIFDGFMSLVVVVSILNGNFATRHLAQLTTSLAQLYGVTLYFFTNILENYAYTHPHPFYFWVYFVGMNLPWVILPVIFSIQSWRAIESRINSPQAHLKQQ